MARGFRTQYWALVSGCTTLVMAGCGQDERSYAARPQDGGQSGRPASGGRGGMSPAVGGGAGATGASSGRGGTGPGGTDSASAAAVPSAGGGSSGGTPTSGGRWTGGATGSGATGALAGSGGSDVNSSVSGRGTGDLDAGMQPDSGALPDAAGVAPDASLDVGLADATVGASDGGALPLVCTPTATRCLGAGVQTCGPDGQWGVAVPCTSGACVGGQCSGSCVPNTTQCSGTSAVQTCSASGTWAPAVACTNQACVLGACTGVCTPGTTGCNGLQPQTCNSSGQWEDLGPSCAPGQACAANGTCLCNTSSGCTGCCDGNVCVAYAAESNTVCGSGGASCAACTGGQQCSATTGQCECPAGTVLCGGTCMACAAGQRCNGTACVCDSVSCPNGCCSTAGECLAYGQQNAQTCGTGGLTCGSCSGATPVCLNGGCATCSPSAAPECSGRTTLRSCQADGSWGPDTLCPTLCSNGACLKATAISAGSSLTCALLSNGTVYCWGDNRWGGLGLGSTEGPETCTAGACSTTPRQVLGLTSTATAVAGGGLHECALLSGPSMQCWGDNASGQLGNATTAATASTPVAVSVTGGVTGIGAGFYHTCAVASSAGNVWCWGFNGYGQLGNGTTTNNPVPQLVPSLSGVVEIGGGDQHPCARLSGGTVRCWGGNVRFQLGGASTTVDVSGVTGATSLATGALHTCALVSSGVVWCWGANGAGQVGDGSTSDRIIPWTVLSGAAAIDAGSQHTCSVLSASGAVMCWGHNDWGKLGTGSTTGPQTCGTTSTTSCSTTPVAVVGLAEPATALALGGNHTCTLLSSGSVQCWGQNGSGQLGRGISSSSSPSPAPVTW
jgi:alpha-tubulin suppressor-like RCC1 family protein